MAGVLDPDRDWYRIVSRKAVARKELLRSRRGRFHDDPVGEPTTYMADSPLTAWLEVTARFGAAKADPDAFRLYRVKVGEARLADLRTAAGRTRARISENDLLRDPAPPQCREAARRLRSKQAGYDGLVYPSIRNRPHGFCAALFLERVKRIRVAQAADDWRRFQEDLR